jgi:hypothetical protein
MRPWLFRGGLVVCVPIVHSWTATWACPPACLIVAVVSFRRDEYPTAFGVLLIPALLALGVLVLARMRYPHPQDFEVGTLPLETRGFPRVF